MEDAMTVTSQVNRQLISKINNSQKTNQKFLNTQQNLA
jgi:hypothetical protein